MSIIVKAVEGPAQKSKQEVEEQLLKEQQEREAAAAEAAAQKAAEEEAARKAAEGGEGNPEPPEIKDEDVLSYIKNKYKKEDLTSIDDLFKEPSKPELPPLVEKYLEYQKETNRGFEDFLKTQEDFSKKDPMAALKEYYSQTEEGLDEADVEYLIEDKFGYDKDLDDESVIKSKELLKKKELAKAKKFFEKQKEAYKVPDASSAKSISQEDQEALKQYKEFINKSQTDKQVSQQRSDYFAKKTDELFNDDFKGFEFKVGEQKIVFNPGDREEVKKSQSSIQNFIGKYLDENGLIKDPAGYHKALSAALNPEKMANFFYEKGKADAIAAGVRETKNINMNVRTTPQMLQTKGFQVKAVESSGRSDGGLKVRSVK